MGNAKSTQPVAKKRPMFLIYLINRTWNMVMEHKGNKSERQFDYTDRDDSDDISSGCSGCDGCGYLHNFDLSIDR